jgi:hypothetical protein
LEKNGNQFWIDPDHTHHPIFSSDLSRKLRNGNIGSSGPISGLAGNNWRRYTSKTAQVSG